MTDTNEASVRVRIAVAVTASGYWNASGWDDPIGGETTLSESAIRDCEVKKNETPRIVWVEASVPLPEAHLTVEGVVAR